MSIKKIIAAVIAVIMVICTAVSITAVEPESAKLKVIDVSMWNGTINWSLASAEVDGVIARIGYRGSEYHSSLAEDSLFSSHMQGAQQYGLHFGVYFYSLALNESEAKEEAEWVINKLKYYNCKPDLPIYIDMEDASAMNLLTSRQRTDIIVAFCKTMKNNGYYGGVYSNKYWLTSLLYPSDFEDYPVWIAQYNTECTYDGKYGMWQYSDSGSVAGISEKVDMNDCYFDYPAFIKKYSYNGYKGSEDIPTQTKDYSKRGTYKMKAQVNVKAGAADSYSTLGTLASASEVYVDYAIGDWGVVPYGNSSGWIKLGSSTERTSKYMTTQSGTGYYVVNTDVLNVREGPSTNYNIVSTQTYGATVFISGLQNNWGFYYANSTKRWICLDYADFYGTICFETGVNGKYIQPLRIKKGSSAKLTKWDISITDKTFAGWSTTSGGAVQYADCAQVTMGGANMVLYAVNNSKNTYTFAKNPRQAENGMVVIGDECIKTEDFMKKYITVSGGCTYTAKPALGSYLGTGSEITFAQNGTNTTKLTVVVSGDCNGDGICDGIDIADALNISQGDKSTVTYSQAQKKAADVNLDGKVDSADITVIRNAAFGTADLPK